MITDGTTEARIDGAAALGRLSIDEEVRYRLQAALAPARVPEQYRGKPGRLSATPVLLDAQVHWDRLSARTRELAARHLVPPIYGQHAAQSSRSAQARNPVAPQATCVGPDGEQRILQPELWDSTRPLTVPAVVHWLKMEPQNAKQAKTLAAALEASIWPELTRAMSDDPMIGSPRLPLPDHGPCGGPDNRLDIYVVGISGKLKQEGAIAYTGAPKGCRAGPSFVVADPTATPSHLAHEFMHVMIYTYERRNCTVEYKYLNEAAAEWAVGLVNRNDSRRLRWDSLLRSPASWFGPANSETAGYGGWWFLDAATRRLGNGIVASAYRSASQGNSYKALATALGDNLADEWAHFAALAWNERLGGALPESFFTWYGWKANPRSSVPKRRLNRGQSDSDNTPLPIAINGWGKQYYDLRIEDPPSKTKYITLNDLGALKLPRFRSVIYYRNVLNQWKREDLTDVPKRAFCRDDGAASDIRRVIVINSLAERQGSLQTSPTPSITLARKCPSPRPPMGASIPCMQPSPCDVEVLAVQGEENWNSDHRSEPSGLCVTNASATHMYSGGGPRIRYGFDIIQTSRRRYEAELGFHADWRVAGSGRSVQSCDFTGSFFDPHTEVRICEGSSSDAGSTEVIGYSGGAHGRLPETIEIAVQQLIWPRGAKGRITSYERTPPDPDAPSPVGNDCEVGAFDLLTSPGGSTSPATVLSLQTLLSGSPVTVRTATTDNVDGDSATWSLSVTFRVVPSA